MRKRTLLFPGGLIAAALLCLTAMGCSSSNDSTSSSTKAATAWTVPDDEIRIGLEGPLTGAQIGVGRGMLNGARMAADELNAVGGIDGKMITIVGIDDQTDPGTGVAAAISAIAPYTYDSVVLPASAASEVDGFDEAPLRSALQAEPISGWPGWTGSASFDASTGDRQPAPVVVPSTRDDGTLHLDEAWWSTATGFKF